MSRFSTNSSPARSTGTGPERGVVMRRPALGRGRRFGHRASRGRPGHRRSRRSRRPARPGDPASGWRTSRVLHHPTGRGRHVTLDGPGRQHGHPDGRLGAARDPHLRAEQVAAQLVPPGVARPPAGEADRPADVGACAVEQVEAQPFHVCDPGAHRGEHARRVVDLLRAGGQRAVAEEPTRIGFDEREPLTVLGQRVAQRDVADLARALGERVEVLPAEQRRDHARAGAGRASGQPQVAVGSAVGVHRAGRIVQQGVGDALEGEGGPEHRVPLPRRQRARGELGGAAVGHAGDDAHAFRQPGPLRRVRADVPEHAARRAARAAARPGRRAASRAPRSATAGRSGRSRS